MTAIPAFPPDSFDRLGQCHDERETVGLFAQRVDRLIALLNHSDGCSRIAETRSRWHPGKSDNRLFADRPIGAVEYFHGYPAHWYFCHRGGRWEPQFNVGMFGGAPGQRRYLRFGVGFCLNLNSKDPDREARLIDLRALFQGFLFLIKGPYRHEFRRLLGLHRRLTLERDGLVPDPLLNSADRIIDWLLAWEHPDGWLFIGESLSPDLPAERPVLENWYELVKAIDRTFAAWRPTWVNIWQVAGH